QDVELAAQALALRAGSIARATNDQIAASDLADAEAEALKNAADLCWSVQATGQLLLGGVITPDRLGEGGQRMLARETGHSDLDALAAAMLETSGSAEAAIDRILKGS
ncbi:MAG: glutamine-synthetase adenylyltransferase, partial [Pseudomonadota bacterium]